MDYRDYYKILGVPKSADEKEIKKAYRRLARQYHPDRNPGDRASEEKLKEINEAYEVLGSPENRSRYDQLGHNYHRFRQMGGNPTEFNFSQWFGQDQGNRVNVNLGDLFGGRSGSQSGFSDFFEAIFGGGAFGQPVGRQRDSLRQKGRNTANVEQTVTLTLEEAFHGTERTFEQNGDTFTAKIPAGASTGTRIRLRGKGNPGPTGKGDLYLVVQVKPHPIFRREGPDLHANVEVDVLTAVLGGSATVPTIAGPVKLTIPQGTQGGQTFRLKGKGMPHLRKQDTQGDLLATVKIRVPSGLTAEEEALYQKLAGLRQQGTS